MLSRKTLLKKVSFPTAREERVLWNLRRYGAPLSNPGVAGLDLTLEQALAEGLSLARRFPYVAQVWPVVYVLNQTQVDLDRLETMAVDAGHGNTLGFFLNVSRLLTDNPVPTDHELRLTLGRSGRPEEFFLQEHGPLLRALVEKRSPQVAKDWDFRMLTTMEHFQETFDTFVG